MQELKILAGIMTVTAVLVPIVAIGGVYIWKRSIEASLSEARKRHLRELNTARQAHDIAKHELMLDAQALQLACMELAQTYDDETDEPIFDGNWEAIRQNLRDTARDHAQDFAYKNYQESVIRIRQKYGPYDGLASGA